MAASVGRMAEASDIELHHTGKSYTSDTLRMLHQQYPDAELWLLMGSDMFLSLHTWHEPEVICELAHIAAFRRVEEDIHAAMEQQKTQLERQYQAHVALLDNPELIELSSTDVRAALAAGQGSDLVPEAVWGYIRREHLYGTTADLKHLTVDELRPIAMSYLKPKRMPHVLGTEGEAAKLADASVRTRRRPAWRDCFTTAPRSWAWRSSWRCVNSTASGLTRWSKRC